MLAALTFVMVAATLPPVKAEWWIIEEEKMNNREKVLEVEGILAEAGCMDAFMTAVAVVKIWPKLKAVMEPELFAKRGLTGGKETTHEHGEFTGSTPAGSTVEAERALKLEAPMCPVCGNPEDNHATYCTPQKRLKARRERVAQREADFEAENDANEFKREPHPVLMTRDGVCPECKAVRYHNTSCSRPLEQEG